MYRWNAGALEVFLAHPGGPLFAKKDAGYWTIPKGEIETGEDLLAAAIREFKEEVGIEPRGEFLELGSIRQKGGKIVHAWAFQGELDESHSIMSNTFKLEWPPHSGKIQDFPEVDRAQFFPLTEAKVKIKETQRPFLDRLESAISRTRLSLHGN